MPIPDGLTPKQEGFIKDYLETGNGTQAALNNYDTDDYDTASVIAWENLRKPKLIAKMQSWADQCAENVLSLANTAESEQVRLAANRDLLDRSGFKPIDKSESKVQQDVSVSSTEFLLTMANELSNKIQGDAV